MPLFHANIDSRLKDKLDMSRVQVHLNQSPSAFGISSPCWILGVGNVILQAIWALMGWTESYETMHPRMFAYQLT